MNLDNEQVTILVFLEKQYGVPGMGIQPEYLGFLCPRQSIG
jgi:hypothetical protein